MYDKIILKLIKLHKKGGALLSVNLSCKRISSFFSKSQNATMTLEACLILPFFLFAFLNIISIIEVYRLQGNMSIAMHDTVKQMAVYGYEYKEIKNDSANAAESLGLTYLYAANKVKDILGTDYLDNSLIHGGSSSISWLRSKVMDEDDCIDLVAKYRVSPATEVAGYNRFSMYNRLRTRAWTGYDNTKDSKQGDELIVYITPDGDVYHRSRSCTYLKLSILAVDIDFMDKKRNENGAKYYACEECGNGHGSTVYITQYGDRYHARLSCSKLKRTVLAVPISQAGGRGACSKCGLLTIDRIKLED